ncbi:TonB-dependent siderophore receptor [Poseidonocella sp. HB161398]|uniref:TonB-dependent siderophore receptor n=1 Tax=Poseidonocella sp. HB161398 TaxID=2320855 RepID=UPI0011093F7D|nr:TonB-dependent siderophore receptor [Poseidonocella sp. HB161398]
MTGYFEPRRPVRRRAGSRQGAAGRSAWMAGRIALCLAMAVPLPAGMAAAQEAAADRAISFDIPAQDLNRAILSFANRAGVQVLYDTAAVSGLRSAAVNGTMPADQAIAQLLRGTGISYRFTSPTSLSLILPGEAQAPGSDVLLLDPIYVNGERANGPVDGYIAERSATLSKTDTPIAETPGSVSVVTADQARAQSAASVVQALRYSPGVNAEVRGSSTRYDIPYMRGFGSPSESVLYADGLPLLRGSSYSIPQIDIAGIERVELLKGPSSSIYGGTQAGGLVNVVTKRPTATPQGEVSLTYGSFNRVEGTVDLSGPVAQSETLSYRFIGHFKDADTQVRHTEEQRVFLNPSLNWHPDADTELNVSLSYTHDPEGGYYGVLPTFGSVYANPGFADIPKDFFDGEPAHDQFEREQVLLTADLRRRLTDVWTLNAKASYIDLTVDTASVLPYALAGTTIYRYAWDTQEDLDGVALDANVLGEFATGPVEHDLLFGVNYQRLNWDYQAQYGAAPSIDYLDPVYGQAVADPGEYIDQYQEQSQAGIYLQDKATIGRVDLWAGLRYDHVETDTRDRIAGTDAHVTDEELSGRLAAVYNFDNGVSTYASWSTSFLPVAGTDTATGDAFEPLTAEQYEIGVKYAPQAFPGLFTLAVYDITQDNTITTNTVNEKYQNGRTEAQGIEFEAKFRPLPNWNVVAAIGAVDAELVEGEGYAVGHSPVGTPEKTASIWSDYAFERGALRGLAVGAGLRHVGSSTGGFQSDGSRIRVPSYTLADAMVSYDLAQLGDGWTGMSMQLNVTNLFDETYVTCLGNNFCNYGNERAVSLKLTRRW